MISRILPTVVSFLTVTTAYWLYALLAVPWIEPSAREVPSESASESGDSVEKPTDRYQTLLEPFFASDSWQRQDAKVLKSGDFMLLFRDYQPLQDGTKLELKPCTLILNPEAAAESNGTPSRLGRRSIILEAPEGATLDFDGPLSLAQGGLGRLVAARLDGEVLIRGPESQPHAGDALEIRTEYVKMTSHQISTASEVSFRYGSSVGRGSDLMINLAAPEQGEVRRLPSTTPTQLRSLELVHLDELTVVLPMRENQALGRGPPRPAQAEVFDRVDVSCEGPLLLDFVGGSLALENKVVINRRVGNGVNDWLACETLILHFAAAQKLVAEQHVDATTAQEDPWQRMQVSQIVALGHPAKLESPSYDVQAHADCLDLHLKQRRVLLQDKKKAVFRYGTHVIQAPRMECFLDQNGGLNRAHADGPGSYRGSSEKQRVSASWRSEFAFGPRDGRHVLSVSGNAHIDWGQSQRVTANTMHLWLRHIQPTVARQPPRPNGMQGWAQNWRPERVVAEQDVNFASPQVVGKTDFAEILFAPAVDDAGEPAQGLTLTAPQRPESQSTVATGSVDRYFLQGDAMHVVLTSAREPQLRQFTVRGDVHLSREPKDPSRGEMELRGDLVQVTQDRLQRGQGVVEGQPALVRVRGVEVSADRIRVDQGANRVWTEQPGSAALPLPADVAARYSRRRATARIGWQGAMSFDGQTVLCDRGVEIRGPEQIATARRLRVSLNKAISLDRAKTDTGDVQVQEFELDGDVWLEGRTHDDEGLHSINELALKRLTINQQTGQLHGIGPGWISTVRYTQSNFSPGRSAVAKSPQLSHIRVDFQKRMEGEFQVVGGDFRFREINVSDQVQAIYGPIANWHERLDQSQAASPGPGIVVIRCAQLTVAQMSPAASGPPPLELTAWGNTEVEGQTFWARAHRIRYAQAKGMLIMEGDGRSAARLSYQSQVGGPRQRALARKIQYWIDENRLTVEGVISGDLNLPSQ